MGPRAPRSSGGAAWSLAAPWCQVTEAQTPMETTVGGGGIGEGGETRGRGGSMGGGKHGGKQTQDGHQH